MEERPDPVKGFETPARTKSSLIDAHMAAGKISFPALDGNYLGKGV
jgi:hypothetical protein